MWIAKQKAISVEEAREASKNAEVAYLADCNMKVVYLGLFIPPAITHIAPQLQKLTLSKLSLMQFTVELETTT